MRLEKQQQQELAKRQGLTGRTIVQTVWFFITGAAAYFLLEWLIAADYLSMGFFHNRMLIPHFVPDPVIKGLFVLVVVIIMQFFLLIGFVFASPQGRARTGKPTPYSTNPDPFENDYRN